jgi:hypothetical protein
MPNNPKLNLAAETVNRENQGTFLHANTMRPLNILPVKFQAEPLPPGMAAIASGQRQNDKFSPGNPAKATAARPAGFLRRPGGQRVSRLGRRRNGSDSLWLSGRRPCACSR